MIAEIYDKQGSLVCTRQDTLELVERNNMYYITLISSPFRFNRIELWYDPDTKVGLFQHETFHPGEGRYAIPKLREPNKVDSKICKKCGKEKPSDDFYKRTGSGRPFGKCKECRKVK